MCIRDRDKGALTISAWKETSEAGNPYTSLKVREFSSDSSYSDPNSERNVLHKEESEDEIDW